MGAEKYRRNNNRNTARVVIRPGVKIRLLLAGLLMVTGASAEVGDDAWLEQDFESDTAAVNEGELEILQQKPGLAGHYQQQWLTITADSLASGWVSMRQCHRQLDQVGSMQIVYQAGRMRGLAIDSYERIGKAWVSGDSVQLQGIEAGSVICISASTRALHQVDGAIELKNGPFMRRFLDGYYPMRIRLEVSWPSDLLQLQRTQPVQAEYTPGDGTSTAVMDVWFSGRLNSVFEFSAVTDGGAQ